MEFKDCRMIGTNFSESSMHYVRMDGCSGSYLNASYVMLKNAIFQNCKLDHSFFQYVKLQNLEFEGIDFTGASFAETPMNGLDLSSCKLDRMSVSMDKLKGLTVTTEQALDFIALLGLKLK